MYRLFLAIAVTVAGMIYLAPESEATGLLARIRANRALRGQVNVEVRQAPIFLQQKVPIQRFQSFRSRSSFQPSFQSFRFQSLPSVQIDSFGGCGGTGVSIFGF